MAFSFQIPTSCEAMLSARLYLIVKGLALPIVLVLDSEGRKKTSNWETAAGCCFKNYVLWNGSSKAESMPSLL